MYGKYHGGGVATTLCTYYALTVSQLAQAEGAARLHLRPAPVTWLFPLPGDGAARLHLRRLL